MPTPFWPFLTLVSHWRRASLPWNLTGLSFNRGIQPCLCFDPCMTFQPCRSIFPPVSRQGACLPPAIASCHAVCPSCPLFCYSFHALSLQAVLLDSSIHLLKLPCSLCSSCPNTPPLPSLLQTCPNPRARDEPYQTERRPQTDANATLA